jgi:hypothetical protein
MGRARVYVETTIPSFYHEERTAPDIVARREWTRQWWSDAPERYELVTSAAVLDELAGGPPERSPKWLDLVRDLPLLAIEAAIAEIGKGYEDSVLYQCRSVYSHRLLLSSCLLCLLKALMTRRRKLRK